MNTRFRFGWDQIRQAWSGILGSPGKSSVPKVNSDLPPADQAKIKQLMDDCLAARGGDVSARQRAATLGEVYLTVSQTGRKHFLETLADHFSVDRERVKLSFDYVITHVPTGDIVCTGFTRHCAVNAKGIPVEIDEKTLRLWEIFPT